jgi:hypothetical protein
LITHNTISYILKNIIEKTKRENLKTSSGGISKDRNKVELVLE